MASIDDFRERLRAAMSTLEEPCKPADLARLMAEQDHWETRFWDIADRLFQAVIEPRLTTLVQLFENAHLARHNPRNARSVFLGYQERFPCNARLDFQLFPDYGRRSLVLLRETHISPAFMRFERFSRWEGPLEEVDEEEVTIWIEEQLVLFAKTLLRFTRETAAGEPIPALDPVCGMAVRADPANLLAEYLGHPYYFCSATCRARFLAQPLMFVTVSPE